MRYAVYLPLVLSAMLALPPVGRAAGSLADRVDPRIVTRLLLVSTVVAAAASLLSLGLLTAGGIARLAAGAGVTVGRHADPGGLPIGVAAALVLLAVLVRAARHLLDGAARRRGVRAVIVDGPGEVSLIDDDAVYAVATPGHGRVQGRVVASRGLWDALDVDERAVVVAHERAHLDGRHHRYLAVAGLAAALDPPLDRLRGALAYALERCADEAAVTQVGDRAVAARAVGRAALAARRRPPSPAAPVSPGGPGLGVTTGPVPRRVAALMAPSDTCATAWTARLRRPVARHAGDLVVALGTAVLLVALVALAATAVLHATWDLTDVHGTLTARIPAHLLR